MGFIIDFFPDDVLARFTFLSEFHRHSESQLQEGYHTNRSFLASNDVPAGLDDFDVQAWFADRNEELHECDYRYTVVFPRIMRYAMVTMCYTLTESNLSRIANEMARRKTLSLDLEDLQAKDLTKRFEKFWTQVAGLTWWEDRTRWNLLKDIEQLRNCIAHRNGVLRKNEKRIHELVHRGVGISAGPDVEHGGVLISEQFCADIIEEMAALFREILERAGCFGHRRRHSGM